MKLAATLSWLPLTLKVMCDAGRFDGISGIVCHEIRWFKTADRYGFELFGVLLNVVLFKKM